jgi:hypothetical protein
MRNGEEDEIGKIQDSPPSPRNSPMPYYSMNYTTVDMQNEDY